MGRSKLATQLRQEQREAELAMSPADRFLRALELGELGLQLMQAGQRISRAEAYRRLRAEHQQGRRPSRVNDA